MNVVVIVDETLRGSLNFQVGTEFNRVQSRFSMTIVSVASIIEADQAGDINQEATFKRAKKYASSGEDLYVIATRKRFPDNFFSKKRGRIKIYSFSQWEYLTDAPVESGVLCAIAVFIIQFLYPEIEFHDETRGCPFDFKADKTRIDLGLKKGKLCGYCRELFDARAEPEEAGAISAILDLTAFMAGTGRFPRLGTVERAGASLQTTEQEASRAMVISLPFVPSDTRYYNPSREKIIEIETLYNDLCQLKSQDIKAGEKGKAFEIFCCSLVGALDGFELYASNVRLDNCEIDLSFKVDQKHSDLHEALGPVVFVECKNRAQPAGASDLSHHILNLAERNLSAGIFISVGGISGYDPTKKSVTDSFAKIVTAYRKFNVLTLPIVWADIEAIRNGMNLYSLLVRRRMEIIHQ